jgi:hypothetical protein
MSRRVRTGILGKLVLYVRNLGLLANLASMALIGQDPRKTISAFVRLKGLRRAELLLNMIYRDPRHCEDAAAGWDDPRVIDRSLW